MTSDQLQFQTVSMTKDQFYYAYQTLAIKNKEHLLLESGRGGKMCIAGVRPLATLRALDGDALQVRWRDGREEVREGDPLELVTSFVEAYTFEPHDELPDFQGGALGFISYDNMRRYEPVPSLAIDDLHTPDVYFYVFDEWAVLDIETETAYFMMLPTSPGSIDEMAARWKYAAEEGIANRRFKTTASATYNTEQAEVEVAVTQHQFENMVRAVQRYIKNGDVTQVNLSVRQSKPLHVEPLVMYEALRQVNPSPYMASIGAQDFAVVSGSPELLIKKRGDEVSTRPIGGTRPRGETAEADQAFEQELVTNVKEQIEHKMLVDVEVEDFKLICREGSVETNEFMVVEKYSHVMHLVSNVRGLVADHLSNAEVLRGVFPGGSITGSPKLRTMEIIEELEPTRRGLYTGSIGWIGFSGNMEFNIVIRTAYIREGKAFIQAGAGLVAESSPTAEYVESLNKARALWQAKELAEREC